MINDAALVLALFDGSRPLDAEDEEILELLQGQEAIVLLNKSDLQSMVTAEELSAKANVPGIEISTRENHGLDALAQAIQQKVYGGEVTADEGSFVSDERQANLLRTADNHLAAALQTIEAGMGLDFISIDLRSAWEKLGEITGDTVGEDIIDEIFSKFCIGK